MRDIVEREFEIETEIGTVKGVVVLDVSCDSTTVEKVFLDDEKDILNGMKDLVTNAIEEDPEYYAQKIREEEIDQQKHDDAESRRERDLLGE